MRAKLLTALFALSPLLVSGQQLPFFDGAQDAKSRETMAQAERDIEKYRKGDFEVTIVDAQSGKPITQEVEIELANHKFDFGVNLYKVELQSEYMIDKAHKAATDIFNMVAVCDYFSSWNYSPRNKVSNDHILKSALRDIEFANANDLRMRFHAVWYNQPLWLNGFNWSEEEIWTMFEERIKYVAEHYGDEINEYDVINEIIFWHGDFYSANPNYPDFMKPELAKRAFELARKYLPTQKLVALEAAIATTQEGNSFAKALQHHRDMIAAGVDYDYVGYQGHFYYKDRDYRDGREDLGDDCFTMAAISGGLDLLGELGKPVVITEFNGPSRSTATRKGGKRDTDDSNDQNDPYWSLSEEENAAWQINFYRLAFSKPYIRQVTRWFMVDEMGGKGIDAGVITKTGEPHAIYEELRKLIKEEWHTKYKGKSRKGVADFRGFYGRYDINVDGYQPAEVEINEAGEYVVKLNKL